MIAMKKKKAPRPINAFQRSKEFREAFELYKQKTQGEIEGQPTTLNEPQNEGRMTLSDPGNEVRMNLVEPQFEPQNDPPLRVGCQQPQIEGAFEGAIYGPERPSEAEVAQGEFVTLHEVQELVDEVQELRNENVALQEEMSQMNEHLKQGEKDIDQLKEFTDYGENVRYYDAWNKLISKVRGDGNEQ